MEYVMKTQSLSKRYKKFTALDGLTMNVPKGAIYGFVGRNGAGKTTLIRIITGLQPQSEGEYEVFGAKGSTKEIYASRARMGAIVETPSIHLDCTAEENLLSMYRIMGLPKDGRIKELLTLVGLGDTGKKRVKNFSLGMKQRLAIAMALCNKPDLLILDEPINGLDPQGIIEIRELIIKLNREKHITVLISSHILDELSRLATHYGFIDKGRIVKEMSAEELEDQCKKCLSVTVSDMGALTEYLESNSADYRIANDNSADIYSQIRINELVTTLDSKGCEVLHISEREESLESFFINLIGGEANE
ncbi:ABC transporter ATP-binding protein [Ruminococcus sp. NK3A76]|uniref:ABC transporter ATP-binding protein n=1 Tax=Ruminococcus sp. NK3A76 TaxID=877411 RepID=UPI00048E049E|nr:ABC transporter ATP-binding protein [Ruminococcus sp. NK3A76]